MELGQPWPLWCLSFLESRHSPSLSCLIILWLNTFPLTFSLLGKNRWDHWDWQSVLGLFTSVVQFRVQPETSFPRTRYLFCCLVKPALSQSGPRLQAQAWEPGILDTRPWLCHCGLARGIWHASHPYLITTTGLRFVNLFMKRLFLSARLKHLDCCYCQKSTWACLHVFECVPDPHPKRSSTFLVQILNTKQKPTVMWLCGEGFNKYARNFA